MCSLLLILKFLICISRTTLIEICWLEPYRIDVGVRERLKIHRVLAAVLKRTNSVRKSISLKVFWLLFKTFNIHRECVLHHRGHQWKQLRVNLKLQQRPKSMTLFIAVCLRYTLFLTCPSHLVSVITLDFV